MSFSNFIAKKNVINKASSSIKIQQIISFSSLSDVKVHLRDGLLSSVVGIAKLHPSKGTPWVQYNKKNYFDSYGCSHPQKTIKVYYRTKWILFIF